MKISELYSKLSTNKELRKVRFSFEAMQTKTRNPETICSHTVPKLEYPTISYIIIEYE